MSPVPRALIDACVMVHHRKLDLLLRLATEGILHPLWSVAILDEADAALVRELEWDPAIVASRRRAMQDHFPEASVTGYEPLVESMGNHPGDRHVLAAAVAGSAGWLVTENLKHFRREQTLEHGIEAISTAALVKKLRSAWPAEVDEVLAKRAEKYQASLSAYPASLGKDFLALDRD
jgi:hypothetical protein